MIIDEKYLLRPTGYQPVSERRSTPHVERIRPSRRVQDEHPDEQEQSSGHSLNFKEEHRKAAEKKRAGELRFKEDFPEEPVEEEMITISKAFYHRLLAENEELKELMAQLRNTLKYSMTGIRQNVMTYQVQASEEQLKKLAANLLYLEQRKKNAYLASPLESFDRSAGWKIDSFMIGEDDK
ncbi:hypothetical protein [Marinicrinis lubricantis]|uniref:Uncharacterized protein n=1 Tax=Marinicrinis lubricantis TaxID=2086470 RepID=A0ABW1INJ7_9BACL